MNIKTRIKTVVSFNMKIKTIVSLCSIHFFLTDWKNLGTVGDIPFIWNNCTFYIYYYFYSPVNRTTRIPPVSARTV